MSVKNGFITLHRKILESAIFENPNELKVWIWCLCRANWSDNTVFFSGEEINVRRGQFIFGRFTGSDECNMNPNTFYKILKKLEKAGMILINSNNKKSLLTVVKYEIYQDGLIDEQQQSNNKVTTKQQQSNTDNNITIQQENKRTYTRTPQNIEEVIEYGKEIELQSEECNSFFDHFQSNGWKVGGKAPMKDWKASLRNWKRNSNKFKANGNGNFNGNRQSDATKRATFRHTEQQIQDLKDFGETLRQRYPERS